MQMASEIETRTHRAIGFIKANHLRLGDLRIHPGLLLVDHGVLVDVTDDNIVPLPHLIDGAIYCSLISAVTGWVMKDNVRRRSPLPLPHS